MSTTTTPEVRTEALAILDRMQTMVDNEMVARVGYIGDDIVRPDLKEAGAIYGGRNACAVGSLWLAAGARLRRDGFGGVELPGISAGTGQRKRYMARKPALKCAYTALNVAAEAYSASVDLCYEMNAVTEGQLEDLFENAYDVSDGGLINPSELTGIIAAARAAIEAS